jgi:hypothetical protein
MIVRTAADKNETRRSEVLEIIKRVYPKAGSVFIADLERIATTKNIKDIRENSEIPEMRLALALNPDTPSDIVLKILKENRSPEIAKVIVSHSKMSEEGFLFLIEHEKNKEVIVAAINNTKVPIPKVFLETYMKYEDPEIQSAIMRRFLSDLRGRRQD